MAYSQPSDDAQKPSGQNASDPISLVNEMNALAFLKRVSNPDSTIRLTLQSEKLALENNYIYGAAVAKLYRGMGYVNVGKYYPALLEYQETLLIFDSLGNENSVANTYNSIGILYERMREYDKSMQYYRKALSVHRAQRDTLNTGILLNNMGYVSRLNEKYDSALIYLNEALAIGRMLKIDRRVMYPTYNVGAVYLRQDKLDLASLFLNESYQLAKQYDNRYLLSLVAIDLGLLAKKQSNEEEAHRFFLESFEASASGGIRLQKAAAAKHLSKAYEHKNELREALKYQRIYQSINDSLFSSDLAIKTAFQEAKFNYERERAKEESERLEAEIKQRSELSQALKLRNSAFVALFFMIIISYLLYVNSQRKQKANRELTLLNNKIEQQAEELARVNKEISVMNTNLEAVVNRRTRELKAKNLQLKHYLSTNSHIVRAPLARILGLVDLYDEKEQENFTFINSNIYKSAYELDQVLREINDRLSEET